MYGLLRNIKRHRRVSLRRIVELDQACMMILGGREIGYEHTDQSADVDVPGNESYGQ